MVNFGRWAAPLLLAACVLPSGASGKGPLRVGVSRVDITPPAGAALPLAGYAGRKQGYQGVHDPIYVRAIVLDDGHHQAALVAVELIRVTDSTWQNVSQRVAKETGIPVENSLIAGVHTHSAPAVRDGGLPIGPPSVAYTAQVEDRIVQAVREAQAKLQPARIGMGTGLAYVNMNRREPTPDGRWKLGHNPDMPSDKSVAVVKFETLAGDPIALYINYAVHGVVMGGQNLQVSGDLPGATSRFVEHSYDGKVVAPWTSGAAGDQNPVAQSRTTDFAMVEALGQILGEEVIRVAAKIKTSSEARIWGTQRVVTCPGQKYQPPPRGSRDYKFLDADPAAIRLSLIMVNEIAFAGVSGEILTMIGQRLKRESPFRNTLMVTLANGSAGYIPDDAAYDQVSFEVMNTRFKRGCAESSIINGLLGMMDGYH
jgi:neutral ceramidase